MPLDPTLFLQRERLSSNNLFVLLLILLGVFIQWKSCPLIEMIFQPENRINILNSVSIKDMELAHY